jgi:prevent-host-death family protein
MMKVGSREFKNNFGRYMRAVRGSETLIVTIRGKAVAKIYSPEWSLRGAKLASEMIIEDRRSGR